ncbi:hypothetical protein CY34DRAFT_813492 [Suillus luteus UH-Slu-Lm8-n1]|uniref:Uncharacterized protein n=1 Tax=Suillus luteus UH-Slu-Lm8-n1 TaxID=930992 RepID=A0A0C9Z7Z3_9AGAM|nr:hypothetical protein CY34DRAFT_813492 [Suillus luteus UH-Slu-Lm8-n1]
MIVTIINVVPHIYEDHIALLINVWNSHLRDDLNDGCPTSLLDSEPNAYFLKL